MLSVFCMFCNNFMCELNNLIAIFFILNVFFGSEGCNVVQFNVYFKRWLVFIKDQSPLTTSKGSGTKFNRDPIGKANKFELMSPPIYFYLCLVEYGYVEILLFRCFYYKNCKIVKFMTFYECVYAYLHVIALFIH